MVYRIHGTRQAASAQQNDNMKVTIHIELELPDDTPVILSHMHESLTQLVHDTYVNYVTVAHARDATTWCAKAKMGSENEDPGARMIYQHHETWREICSNAKWYIGETGKANEN